MTKIETEAEKEVERIMQIAFPQADAAPVAETATAPTDHVGCITQQRATFQAFSVHSEEDNKPTAAEGTVKSFIVPTTTTNHPSCQENRNTVAFNKLHQLLTD